MCNPVKATARATGLSDVVDDTSNFINRATTLPDNGRSAAEASQALALQQQTAAQERTAAAQETQAEIAQQSANDALAAEKSAQQQAAAAATPAVDNESAARAADDRMRKLIAAGVGGIRNSQKFLGSAPVGYRVLTGS